MNKLARQMKLKEKIKKRSLSAILILSLVATMVSVAPPDNSVPMAEAEEGTYSGEVVRKVVNNISDLPQSIYGVDNYYHLARGTAERPFVVLEIVPYEEFAEFGYLIGGCEPINMEAMTSEQLRGNAGSTINTLNTAYIFQGSHYFFSDEAEFEQIQNSGAWMNMQSSGSIAGYYELVPQGEGNFLYTNPKADPTPTPTLMPTPTSTPGAGETPTPPPGDGETSGGGAGETPTPPPGDGETSGGGVGETPTPPPGDGETFGGGAGETPTPPPGDDATSGGGAGETPTPPPGDDATSGDDDEEIPDGEGYNSFSAPGESLIATIESGDDSNFGELEITTRDNSDIGESEITSGDDSELGESEITSGDDSELGEPETVTEDDTDLEAENSEVNITVIAVQPLALTDEPISYVGAGKGNLKWHTANELNMSYTYGYNDENNNWAWVSVTVNMADYKGLYKDVTFIEDHAQAIRDSDLRNVGQRIYTKRPMTESDKAVKVDNQAEYANRELFLKNSVLPGASDEQIANFSVVVKTITPAELNANPEWIDYADLISMAAKMHGGESAYVELWKEYNRYGKKSNVTNYDHDFANERDLSWECALKIFEKVTVDENYAAIIFDDNSFQSAPAPSKNIKIDVYNWNLEKNAKYPTFDHTGSKNNFYKLYCMLFAMDSYFFKQIYLSGGEDAIVKDGINSLQTGDAAEYWCLETFLLAPDDVDQWLYSYWISDEVWNKYKFATCSLSTTRKGWCDGHVYAYDGSNSLAMGYTSMKTLTGLEYFTDFAGSINEDEKPHTAEAVQYILGVRSNPNPPTYGKDTTLKVLDLEPSVGMNADSSLDWYLKSSMIRMLLPNYRGNIEVTHQTTAEFIGKIEDLNSTYQLIYMGLDYSAYNTSEQTIRVGNIDVRKQWPDWNDDSLDGMIYLHTGDKMTSSEHIDRARNNRTRSVKWLEQNGSSTELRFPGNDISKLKAEELVSFLNAGYPIVAEQYLYDLQSRLIDPNSNIFGFVANNRDGKTLYGVNSSVSDIENAVKNAITSVVTFTSLPREYNGSTSSSSSAVIPVETANYLPTDGGRAYMEFAFSLNDANHDYSYRIYVDNDRNSKFSDDEIILNQSASVGNNYYRYRIAASMVGLVQWKIEVYRNDNQDIHFVKSGFSAVRNTTGKKKQINVLQIMPSAMSENYKGALDLSNDPLFTKYYENLDDYQITVDSITWEEFESYFYTNTASGRKSNGFYYDYSKESNGARNPVNLDKVGGNLSSYNMFIMGFGDSYGGINLSNEYGAVDYLRYFVDQGKSILFTHDLTSLYDLPANGTDQIFGYTVDALMRDMMGMNRYGAVSNQANNAGNKSYQTMRWVCMNCGTASNNTNPNNPPTRCNNCRNGSESFVWINNESSMLTSYQSANSYDFLTNSNALHGYSYYSMKRLGWDGSNRSGNGEKMPYRYLITNPQGNSIMPTEENGKSSGFNNNNELTKEVSKVNDGQVTVYPYYIGDTLEISQTHAQWYQLNPEDRDVTVWYALSSDDSITSFDNATNGTSLVYAVSPNDAMNNYYIYSKGNIFYSGVGHSKVTGDMEAKLFINTMIAAYNAGFEPPVIEIMNDEATLTGAQTYSIELMQTYDFFTDENGDFEQVTEAFGENDTYTVIFMPVDFNVASTKLTSTIQFEDGSYVTEVKRLSDGKVLKADSAKEFKDDNKLENGQLYSLEYPKKYLSTWIKKVTQANGSVKEESADPIRVIYFNIKNNRVDVDSYNTTILNLDVLPLFPLD